MAFEKCVCALIIGVLAIGYVEGSIHEYCDSNQVRIIDICLGHGRSLVKANCNLNDATCTAAANVANCLNNDIESYINNCQTSYGRTVCSCKTQLSDYIDEKLAKARMTCTVSQIESRCNVHLYTGDGVGENAPNSECSIDEIHAINVCLAHSTPLRNTGCDFSDLMCQVAVNVSNCLNNQIDSPLFKLTHKCRGYLPDYIDEQLEIEQMKCTVSQIEKRCNVHLNTGAVSAPQLVISVFCLLVSVIAGFQYTT